jgi:hypothetical protein
VKVRQRGSGARVLIHDSLERGNGGGGWRERELVDACLP